MVSTCAPNCDDVFVLSSISHRDGVACGQYLRTIRYLMF